MNDNTVNKIATHPAVILFRALAPMLNTLGAAALLGMAAWAWKLDSDVRNAASQEWVRTEIDAVEQRVDHTEATAAAAKEATALLSRQIEITNRLTDAEVDRRFAELAERVRLNERRIFNTRSERQ